MLIEFLLRQTCEVAPWLGTAQGREIYGLAETRACRLQSARHLEGVSGIDGVADAVTARAMMFCTGEMIPERSRVCCEGRQYIVIACRKASGLGQEHLEVELR